MTWISIYTAPEDLQQVLIFDEVNECMIGYYDATAELFIGSADGARISNALFWKPLPKSPMQVGENTDEL